MNEEKNYYYFYLEIEMKSFSSKFRQDIIWIYKKRKQKKMRK